MKIREAGPRDLKLLMQWRKTVLEEVFAEELASGGFSLESILDENEMYYQMHLGKDHVALFAQDENTGQILGCGAMCLYQEMPSPDNPDGKCSYFMNIFTSPAYRHQHVAESVVQELLNRCHEMGIQKIYLETTAQGKYLYQKLGFRKMEGYLKFYKEKGI